LHIGEVGIGTPPDENPSFAKRAVAFPSQPDGEQMKRGKRCKKPKDLAQAKQPADAGLRKIRPLVAGIDVGSEQHFVCAPTSDGGTEIRVFGGTTPDLQALLEWLQKSHLESVAMESTGVYWIPLYELLASRGIEVLLTDTRQFSRVNSLTDEVRTIAQHYRDRGDVENNFDELKNQWGWAGFTTQDRKRCQIMGRVIALVYNWWTIFMRLGFRTNTPRRSPRVR